MQNVEGPQCGGAKCLWLVPLRVDSSGSFPCHERLLTALRSLSRRRPNGGKSNSSHSRLSQTVYCEMASDARCRRNGPNRIGRVLRAVRSALYPGRYLASAATFVEITDKSRGLSVVGYAGVRVTVDDTLPLASRWLAALAPVTDGRRRDLTARCTGQDVVALQHAPGPQGLGASPERRSLSIDRLLRWG